MLNRICFLCTHIYRNIVCAGEVCNSVNVVEMSMCQQNADRFQIFSFNQCNNIVSFCIYVAWVYDGTTSVVVPYNGAVFLKRVDYELFYMYHLRVH